MKTARILSLIVSLYFIFPVVIPNMRKKLYETYRASKGLITRVLSKNEEIPRVNEYDRNNAKRGTSNLSHEDRFKNNYISYLKKDVDRMGRWVVTFVDKSEARRVGLLSNIVIRDSLREQSPVSHYREIK